MFSASSRGLSSHPPDLPSAPLAASPLQAQLTTARAELLDLKEKYGELRCVQDCVFEDCVFVFQRECGTASSRCAR